MKKAVRKDNAFTLIELLLAVTLFAVLAAGIYSSIAIGIKVYKRGGGTGSEYSGAELAFSRMARDLHTAVHMGNIYLVEESRDIYFFSSKGFTDGSRGIYKITYRWQRQEDYFNLLRLEESYVDSLQPEHKGWDTLLSGVKGIDFAYGYIKKNISGEDDLVWKDEWEDEAMPKLIRVEIETDEGILKKIMYCPAGKKGKIKEEL